MGLVNNQKAYDKYLVHNENYGNIVLNGEKIGYTFCIRMPNFRGNYLSCVEELKFTLDDEEVDEGKVEALLNGKRFHIKEFKDMYKEYWDVNDLMKLEVLLPGGLKGKHRLQAVMRLRYGYSAYFGVCKVVTSHGEQTLDFGA